MGWLKKYGQAQNIFGPVKGQGINVVKFLGWLKKFGPAQNILGPVKGQGISASSKTFVLTQKPILLNANHLFVWHKMFVTCTCVNKGLF